MKYWKFKTNVHNELFFYILHFSFLKIKAKTYSDLKFEDK